MYQFKIINATVLILIMTVILSSCSTNKIPKTNVIYILADDLGYGDLSCYGQEKFQTPNIDRLASEGIKFTNHYSGNTVCSPSRAVLMTGQLPGKCYLRGNPPGIIGENQAALDTHWTVLPEIFKAAGYQTGAYGKWGLGFTHTNDAQNPLKHGFDEFCGWKSQYIAHTYYPSSYILNGQEIPLDGKTYVHDIIMEKAFNFIEKNAQSNTPFFCYIPTAIPHAAMHAPEQLHQKWKQVFPEFNDTIGIYSAGKEDKCPPVVNPIAGFAAMMEHLDNQVGELLTLLSDLGIDKNTMIVFTSDNGAHREGGHMPDFWNSTGGLRGGKRDLHEGGIRVPMLVRWPGKIKPGEVTNHISGFHDVLPTMAEIVGQSAPAMAEGLSFLPELTNLEQKEHESIVIDYYQRNNLFSRAVRMGKWKAFLKGNKAELYNLEEDPYEENNIIEYYPDVMKEIYFQIEQNSDTISRRHLVIPKKGKMW